ncbi:hypothetical protein Tco_0104701 [Tanacetum coccineum]
MLEVLDPKILGSLLESTDFATLVFLRYILIAELGVVTDFEVVSLRGTTLVEVILVKGHVFPSIVKVRPVGFHLYPISVNTLPVGCDLLALVELFIPVEDNIDLKSKTTEDIISIGNFMEVLVLNQYVLVRKIL